MAWVNSEKTTRRVRCFFQVPTINIINSGESVNCVLDREPLPVFFRPSHI